METGRDTGDRGLPPIEPIARLPDAALESLRSAVARSGYTIDTLTATERIAPLQLDAVRLPLRRPGPEAVLARLFTYADRVPAGAVAAALGDSLLDLLRGAGVLASADGRVEARLA